MVLLKHARKRLRRKLRPLIRGEYLRAHSYCTFELGCDQNSTVIISTKPIEPISLILGPYISGWRNYVRLFLSSFLLSGKWLVSGEKVNKFERQFSKKFGHSDSLMVNSGSSANLVMIAALKKYFDWHDNDEIIVSPVGFPTTIAPLLQNNLTPVFCFSMRIRRAEDC